MRDAYRLVIVRCRQGRMSRWIGRLLSWWNILLTSRDCPIGDFSHVHVRNFYTSLEELDVLARQFHIPKQVARCLTISQLDDESLTRFMRQLVHRHFADEWVFAKMVRVAYPHARLWDLTFVNSHFRRWRMMTVVLRRSAFSVVWVLVRVGVQVSTCMKKRKREEGPPPLMIWSGAGKDEMQEGSETLSLPAFLRDVVRCLGCGRENILVLGYSQKSWQPTRFADREGLIDFVTIVTKVGEAFAAVVFSLLSIRRQPAFALVLAETARCSWASALLKKWKPLCVVGTIADQASDSPYVIAAKICGIPSCLVSYASLNIPASQDFVWDDLEPGFRHLLYDSYVVWGEPIADLFRHYAPKGARVFVSGPVMFAADSFSPSRVSSPKVFHLGVFDISPHAERIIASIGAGRGWVTLDDTKFFFDDILEVVASLSEIEIRIVIKPKRLHHVVCGYAEYITRLAKTNSRVVVLDASLNPWKMVAQVDAVISMPFTSMTSVGREVGLPSVYYSPHDALRAGNHTMDGDVLIKGKAALTAWLRHAITERPQVQWRECRGAHRFAKILAECCGIERKSPVMEEVMSRKEQGDVIATRP